MKRLLFPLIPLSVSLALAPATPVQAQDVQYESVTRVEIPGVAGRALRIAARLGGGSMETVEKTYIQGRRMRSDGDGVSTIVDLEAGRVTHLDHNARTYFTMTFDEAVLRAQQAVEQARAETPTARTDEPIDGRMNFRVGVENANERERIAGYAAERHFLTMEMEGEFVPEDGQSMERAGTLVLLTDMWTSRDIPAFGARGAFDEASARQAAEASAKMMEGIAAAFADDPRLSVAFEESMREAHRIDGMAVRSTTTFVVVAPGERFDRAAVTHPERQSRTSVAQDAGRAALRGLAGRLGGRGGQADAPEEPQAQEQTQAVLLSVTTEVRNVETGRVDPSLFEVPSGYRNVSGS